MILRTGPLLGPNSIIPGLPEANAACKKEIGTTGPFIPAMWKFFPYSELDEPLLIEFGANVMAAFDFAQTLATAKSVPDVIEYSRAHARDQFNALAAQTKELT
jgi:phasin protein